MKLRDKIILALVDVLLVLFSIFSAMVIRFEGAVPSRYFYGFEWHFLVISFCCVASFFAFGLYEKLWRYAGVLELKNIFFAVIAGYLPIATAAVLTGGVYYSRSIIFISWLLTFFLTGGIRFLLRIIHESTGLPLAGKRALIVGVNDAGEAILRDILRHRGSGYLPVGFIDIENGKKNIRIHNIPILGALEELPEITRQKQIEEIIIALPSPSLIKKVVDLCESIMVEFRVVPPLSELICGRLSVSQVRKVKIEDLLEREEVNLDRKSMQEFLQGKTVLVTGAGGSIGSEICRQVILYNPAKLIMLGRGENSIYEIALETANRTNIPLLSHIADIRDKNRIESLLRTHRPDIIFHTAAHKHVPLMESNVPEAVSNNILGTWRLMNLAEKYRVSSFILLSTDKAVNPTSIMGATKRMAEMALKSLSETAEYCRFSAVRFGNVLDSRGSVIPTFRRQIAMGGPVTVTDERMTRYFMTIPEAVQLVIEAGSMGKAGEIFILDMGRPVRIMDLAKNIIRLSGLEPGKDIQIRVKGVRPGEKLDEELINTGETNEKTDRDKIQRVITDTLPVETIKKHIETLEKLVEKQDEALLRKALSEMIPNFSGTFRNE